mmetsp:Transcript_20469/g.38810  ORF Transcript_20469/g.38810 Transcript_20469/m.38810 type:complete len:373 (-) Transcript_20469:58-1176(-)
MRINESRSSRHASTKGTADSLRALAMLLAAFNHAPPASPKARIDFGRSTVSGRLLQMCAKAGFCLDDVDDLRALALEAAREEERADEGSEPEPLRAMQDLEAGSELVFPVSSNHSEWRGSPVSEHFSYASLEDLFNVATADAFHTSSAFREDLRNFGSTGAMHALFATEGFAKPSWALENHGTISEWHEDGSLQQMKTQGISMLKDILKKHVGRKAPSAKNFVQTFTKLCGKGCRGMFTNLGSEPPSNALEWHQDWSPPDENSFTVSFGFPPADNYTGVGILTEVVRLSHKFGMEQFRQTKFPLASYYQNTTDEDCREADRKGVEALGVTDTYRIQPVFKRGQEILIYRDSDHLHRGPKQDVLWRADCWRFQ